MTATTDLEYRIVAIYRETILALYGYVSRNCGGDRTLAEDVTQEARMFRATVISHAIGWSGTPLRRQRLRRERFVGGSR